ncbi:TetR/AcrR family transcriptional regulator [Saccharomonospora azurea]|uniref:TetR/AcrR family transcriptional regulator n=1 Tax=Saccharomonospora azurea TaxID=40988 RepID=UPI00023FF8E2|nr:TetR/AcrR family transcriptional regulator [Saccharomonospora azurea]EHK88872.1 TetR family transcriptional regulator [Saccharomonospora azurea SZMC 14600]
MSDRDRRTVIAEAALDVVAERGTRGLTHRAVDLRAGLSVGSTSFYFRTRKDLLRAAVSRLAVRAREDFDEQTATTQPLDAGEAARGMAVLLDRMLGTRRRDTLARYALVVEVSDDDELRGALARCAFSVPLAVELLTTLGVSNSPAVGADLVAFAEGLVFDRIAGNGTLVAPPPGSAASVDRLARAVETFLRGAMATAA